jgi:peptidoglycan/xylan/chitin deacetylase (PgdA/CDA1 family)
MKEEVLAEKISRRRFWKQSTQAAVGALVTSFSMSRCSSQQRLASQIERYMPKRDGGCAVAFGYDMDMPCTGVEYLYDRNLGWPRDGECVAFGHLNEDVREYVRLLATISEDYGLGLQFFVQGNTFEETEDAELWTEIADRGHAIDSHMYNHDSLLRTPIEEVRSQLTKTKSLIESHCGTENVGLRGPGGYEQALHGREDVQQVILDAGIKWVTTQFQRAVHGNDQSWIDMIPSQQPVYYPTGLLEIPFCGHQDRSYFDVDMGGSARPVDEWIDYLKGCVDLALENGLWLSLTTHPSTSFKHDPHARYLKEIFEYCHLNPDIILCNYQDLFRWISAENGSV